MESGWKMPHGNLYYLDFLLMLEKNFDHKNFIIFIRKMKANNKSDKTEEDEKLPFSV